MRHFQLPLVQLPFWNQHVSRSTFGTSRYRIFIIIFCLTRSTTLYIIASHPVTRGSTKVARERGKVTLGPRDKKTPGKIHICISSRRPSIFPLYFFLSGFFLFYFTLFFPGHSPVHPSPGREKTVVLRPPRLVQTEWGAQNTKRINVAKLPVRVFLRYSQRITGFYFIISFLNTVFRY